MRRLLPLLLLAGACEGKLEPDLFKRDQPRIDALLDWDGEIVAQADAFYRLDLDGERAVPLAIPGLDKVRQLLMRGSLPLAFGSRGGFLTLRERVDGAWRDVDLPVPSGAGEPPAKLVVDGDAMLLLRPAAADLHRPGTGWRSLKMPTLPFENVIPGHALLAGDLLVLGYNRGEWGGSLVEVDLAKGALVEVERKPVEELRSDVQGRLWAVQGLSHLSVKEGVLRVREKGAWSVFARSGAAGCPPGAYRSVDVDAQGRPWLLVDMEGVYRFDGGGWTKVSKEWPKHLHEGNLYPVYGSGLRMRKEGSALLSFGDAGAGIWDLRRNRLRRISLKP